MYILCSILNHPMAHWMEPVSVYFSMICSVGEAARAEESSSEPEETQVACCLGCISKRCRVSEFLSRDCT